MEIEKEFRSTIDISEGQRKMLKDFEDKFVEMAKLIDRLPYCREKSLAITKLQESKMWTSECIAKNVTVTGEIFPG